MKYYCEFIDGSGRNVDADNDDALWQKIRMLSRHIARAWRVDDNNAMTLIFCDDDPNFAQMTTEFTPGMMALAEMAAMYGQAQLDRDLLTKFSNLHNVVASELVKNTRKQGE